jgi:hypothetical protein
VALLLLAGPGSLLQRWLAEGADVTTTTAAAAKRLDTAGVTATTSAPTTAAPPTTPPTTAPTTTSTTLPPSTAPLPTFRTEGPALAAPDHAVIRGTVTRPGGGPVAGACLWALGVAGTTGPDGRFSLDVPVAAGTTEVVVGVRDCGATASPLARTAPVVHVGPGQAAEIAVPLAPGGGLTGTTPGAGCIRVTAGAVVVSAPVGAAGSWSLPDLPVGPVHIEALAACDGPVLAAGETEVAAGVLATVQGLLGG